MDWTQIKTQIVWGLICAIGFGALGIAYGTNETATLKNRIEQLELRVSENKSINDRQDKQMTNRANFMACAVRHLDYIEGKSTGRPPCDLVLPE